MIVGDTGSTRFVIATPTKTGTTTLEECARRHAGGRISRGGVWKPDFRIMDWEKPRRQHRMVPPEGWENARRYMTVRNPFTRWVSVYEYLKAPHNYSKFGAKEIQRSEWRGWNDDRVGVRGRPLDFEQFLWWLVDARVEYGESRWVRRRGSLTSPGAWRSPWIWLDGLDVQLETVQLGGVEVGLLRTESLWEDLERVRAEVGGTWSTRASIHANKCLRYKGPVWEYWGATCARRLWRDGEWRGSGVVGPCGSCAACAMGLYEESAAVGYW